MSIASVGQQGAASPNSNQDIATPFQIGALMFDLPGSGTFTLGGATLFLDGATIAQNSGWAVTVNNALNGPLSSGTLSVTGNGTGVLTLAGGGTIYALAKSGSHNLAITGNIRAQFLSVNEGSVTASGTEDIRDTLTVGNNSGPGASFSLAGGYLGAAMSGGGPRKIIVGGAGTPTFNQSGSSTVNSYDVSVQNGGTYSMSGGFLSRYITVGGGGVFQQTGGGVAAESLRISTGGQYNISGGTVSSSLSNGVLNDGSILVSGSGRAYFGSTFGSGVITITDGGRISYAGRFPDHIFRLSDPPGGGSALTVDNSGTAAGVNSIPIADGPSGPGGATLVGYVFFNAQNTYTGPTIVTNNYSTLAGTGSVAGILSLQNGSTVAPGASGSPPTTGTFSVGSLLMASGTNFNADIAGSGPGQFDVLNVSGTANVSGATLQLPVSGSIARGSSFTILNSLTGGSSNPIQGVFANASDGAVVNSNGHLFQVNYEGGDGNDLTVTLVGGIQGVSSRKTHATFGTYDLPLPLFGAPAVECRSGGPNRNFTLVFTFLDSLLWVSDAQITSGVGVITNRVIGSDPHEYLVTVSGVNDAQRLTVTLTNVNDSAGYTTSSVSATMRLLLGDTNGNGTVNAADVAQVKASSGQSADATNFLADVNVSGSISAADVALAKANTGHSVP